MTTREISAALAAGVNARYVRINRIASTDTDVFCLKREGVRWTVFYSERGQRFDEQAHDAFDAAYEDLVQRLKTNALHLK